VWADDEKTVFYLNYRHKMIVRDARFLKIWEIVSHEKYFYFHHFFEPNIISH
jgi:hypothetical protein